MTIIYVLSLNMRPYRFCLYISALWMSITLNNVDVTDVREDLEGIWGQKGYFGGKLGEPQVKVLTKKLLKKKTYVIKKNIVIKLVCFLKKRWLQDV